MLPDNWNGEAFKNELLSHPGIDELTTAIHVPLLPGLHYAGFSKCIIPESNDEILDLHPMRVGTNFPKMLKMNLLSGKWFDNEKRSKYDIPIIINQTMAKRLGFDDPIGKQIVHPRDKKLKEQKKKVRQRTIIGVVEDFHSKSLHSRIEPTYLEVDTDDWYILLKLAPNNILETLVAIENIWEELAPPITFNYQFLEDNFRQIHSADKRFQELFISLTLLAILIACLGLFALAAYAAERRTKEIGIRKALGASVSGIVLLLSKEFLILVMISNAIAAPVAYYFMQRWLENFAYRITIGLEVFLLAAVVSLLIALLTVNAHAVRAAMTNPVNALRHE